ncbi:hypothetical protein HLRTI_002448 [Halorhabdus tiamatea SARL4B]|uniref:RNA-binding protein n=1 Tax=Halorhabdus tiamatea SARL4B TaxID=1033806 RepID=F7PH98_9EURY|nr:DUF655 domain-containing protein [Halorhabdus tiamatea]ERJ05566.1 hypothetical protein HLRTI_002448 [Halorhabdus tiamatea SARL4B]CCQ32517.1 RNA-binding protein [Halorhabdus tiamatea SARL4B]
MSSDESHSDVTTAVVLDHLPRGRSDDDRPQYEKEPLAYAVTTADFQLLEMTLTDDADISFGDLIDLDSAVIETTRTVDYGDLSSGGQSELDYAIEDIVEDNERRFVDFFNDAQPITTRLHSLNLLPGIGKKLRNGILDERKRKPFESFEELTERVDGLHNPREVLVDRILEEIREEDLKYRTFARRDD